MFSYNEESKPARQLAVPLRHLQLADWVRVPEIPPMQKIIIALLMVIGGAIAFAAEDSAQWINYTSPTGHYSVLLPAEPKLMDQESTTPSGAKVPQYIAVVEDPSATYMLAYFDYTGANTFSFDKARDGMLANVKGTLQSEKPISLGRYPGREVRISAKSNDGTELISRCKFFDVNKRIYIVQFLFKKANDNSEAAAKATKFFDSFKVAKS
jgi:hypothetical protein